MTTPSRTLLAQLNARRSRNPFLRLKRPRQLGARTIRPLDAVILAIDAARKSGYALYVRGRLVLFGECDGRNPAARREAVELALHAAASAGLRAGLALEVPYGGRLSVLLSLQSQADVWRDTWVTVGGHRPWSIDVQAPEWRAHLFGAARMPREATRRLERITAERILLEHAPPVCHGAGPDADAAICFGYVARSSAALRAAMGVELVAEDVTARKTHRCRGR